MGTEYAGDTNEPPGDVNTPDEFPVVEELLKPLSDRDRDLFLDLLENPPEPTPAFIRAMKKYNERRSISS